jgi:ribosomal-protein-alanine N-acetyltransferase
MEFVLKTPRTLLRHFFPSDLSELHQLHSNAQAMHYLIGGVRASIEETKRDLEKYLDHQARYGFSKWVVKNIETGAFMGRAGFFVIPDGPCPGKEIDLGYALLPEFWGQGYATEIAINLRDYGSKVLSQYHQVGLIKTGHTKSASVLKKIGFQAQGRDIYFGEEFNVYRLPTFN